MRLQHLVSGLAAAASLAACSQTPGAVESAGAAAEQTCIQAVIRKTVATDAAVERSETVWGASLVVVRAGGSLWRCRFSGGVLKGVSSVAR